MDSKRVLKMRNTSSATLTFVGLMGMISVVAFAQTYEVYQTYPGTSMRDRSQPATVYEWQGDSRLEVYQTYPGSSFRDRRQPATVYERQDNGDIEVYETYPGSSMRDWSKPKTVIRECDW